LSNLLTSLYLAFHVLALVVLIGQYLFLSLVAFPVFGRVLSIPQQANVIAKMVSQGRFWWVAVVTILIVTGIPLLLASPFHVGFLNLGNPWSVQMFIKHILVFALIALGVYQDRGIASKLENAEANAVPALLGRFRLATGLLSIGGVFVIGLTALAQIY
jgi:uncharacterized membrane protein